MKKFKNKNILILCFVTTLISCELGQLDDIEPKYKLTEDNAYNTSTKVEAALNGVYTVWRKFSYSPGNLMSYGGITKYIYRSDYGLNIITDDQRDLNVFYEKYYIMIQSANFLIKAMQNGNDIDGLSSERRLEVEGEARLQRAWAHWELLRIYGQSWNPSSEYGIVVNLQPIQENIAKPRNTVQETYDAILEDLDFAIAKAPETNVSYKMSKVTAKGVKAQVLLTMNDYSGAAQVAFEVMQEGNYKLEDNYSDVFLGGYESNEFLFTPYSREKYDAVQNITDIYFTYTDALKDIADEEVGTVSDGDIDTGVGFDTRFAYTHVTGISPNSRTGKYPIELDGKGEGKSNSLHILRLSEIYLIYAEAKARLGSGVDAEALAAMNAIRLRANMPIKTPATKAELIEAIRIEKILELFLEWAQPWHDMVRYHKLGDINITDYRPNISNDDRLVWPIPLKAREANNRMVQNPGY